MDRNILFTEAIKTYNIPRIRDLLEMYPNDLQFLILQWQDLVFDEQGTRQVKEILNGAILQLKPSDLKLYFDLFVAKNLYINESIVVKEVVHDYRNYYEYALKHGRLENANYLKEMM
jgi:hypothetical protein